MVSGIDSTNYRQSILIGNGKSISKAPCCIGVFYATGCHGTVQYFHGGLGSGGWPGDDKGIKIQSNLKSWIRILDSDVTVHHVKLNLCK